MSVRFFRSPEPLAFHQIVVFIRVGILRSQTVEELKYSMWDIEWLDEHFASEVPRFDLDRALGQLATTYAKKLTTLKCKR